MWSTQSSRDVREDLERKLSHVPCWQMKYGICETILQDFTIPMHSISNNNGSGERGGGGGGDTLFVMKEKTRL